MTGGRIAHYFHFQELGANLRTEVLAGLTTVAEIPWSDPALALPAFLIIPRRVSQGELARVPADRFVPAAFRLLEPGCMIAVMDSQFLSGLIGQRVRITAVDERTLPPLGALVLKEVSSLGIVAADERATRFFPWHEIVEIHPAAEVAEEELLGVDSEP